MMNLEIATSQRGRKEMSGERPHASISGGEIEIWLDQGVLMIKAVDVHGGPVELAEHEVDELMDALRKLRKYMDD
jgi:hypothetical protein